MELPKITQEQMMQALDTCYEKALIGIPGSKDCYELSQEYMTKYEDPIKAAKKFVDWQVAKCATSGFITGLPGIIALPVTIPANLASVWYVQLRMIATVANIMGYDPSSDEVQTLAYVCITGASVSKIFKDAGVQFGEKFTMAMIKKIPGPILTKINQKVGFRFVTKLGTKGVINLGKMVPLVGGVIGGAFDLVGTKVIGSKTIKVFIYNDID